MAVRRPRLKPSANLSIKRPGPPPATTPNTKSTGLLQTPAVKEEEKDVKPETRVKVESSRPAASAIVIPTSPFLPPRPSPVGPPPSRSPVHMPHRSPVHSSSGLISHHQHQLDDSIFKSPIMSPSYPPPSRTPNYNVAMKVMSSLDARLEDSLKSPGSPRQRFRPTPVLGQRRGSGQVHDESSGEEAPNRMAQQRVRHISTSSTASGIQKFVPQAVGRMRTESSCSAFSDVSVFKPRRAARSDEYLRLVEARRELLQKCNGATPDKSQLRMYDMIYYNPKTNPMKRAAEEGDDGEEKVRRMSVSSSVSLKEELKQDTTIEAKIEPEMAMPVPQLKLGPNGEMILDEKSLTIETTGEKQARVALANADIVYDDLNSNSGFYKRHKRTRDWAPDETIRFYRCLQVIGTDFSLMLDLFPNRSRRDLKLKFKKEEKTNGFLINKALLDHSSFDIELLKETFRAEDEKKEQERVHAEELKAKAVVDRAELIKKLKQRPQKRISLSERAVDDHNLDLELNTLEFRKHKARKIVPLSPLRAGYEDHGRSPASVVPASPSKTTKWSSPQSPRKAANTPSYYFDSNVDCPVAEKGESAGVASPPDLTVVPCPVPEFVTCDVLPMIKEEGMATSRRRTTRVEDGEQEMEAAEGEEEDLVDGLDLSNLVVVQYRDESGGKSYKVHFLDIETDEMSEEPLDLPQEVIDYIVEAHQKESSAR